MNFRAAFRHIASSARHFSSRATEEVMATSLFEKYNRLLLEKPILTKSITSGVIAFVADIACQKIVGTSKVTADGKKDTSIDWARTARFTALQFALIGPLLHYWYGFLMTRLPGASMLTTVYRVALDQLVFAPFCCIPALFSCALMMEGKTDQIPSKLKADWAPTVAANLALWVPAQFINFKLVPAQFQVLFANSVGLFWNVYLSGAMAKETPAAAAAVTPVAKAAGSPTSTSTESTEATEATETTSLLPRADKDRNNSDHKV